MVSQQSGARVGRVHYRLVQRSQQDSLRFRHRGQNFLTLGNVYKLSQRHHGVKGAFIPYRSLVAFF